MTELIFILLFVAVAGIAGAVFFISKALQVLKHCRFWLWEIAKHKAETVELLDQIKSRMRKPPAPPTPKLLTERVCKHMTKIYFPFLLPEVPKVGAPVKRFVNVSYNGKVVREFAAPLTRCRLDLYPDIMQCKAVGLERLTKSQYNRIVSDMLDDSEIEREYNRDVTPVLTRWVMGNAE